MNFLLFLHLHSFYVFFHFAVFLYLCVSLLWSYFYLWLLSGCLWKCWVTFYNTGVWMAILSFSPKWVSVKGTTQLKCRQIKEDEILTLAVFDVLLKILLQTELRMNETTKEVNATAEMEAFMWHLSCWDVMLRGQRISRATIHLIHTAAHIWWNTVLMETFSLLRKTLI